MFFQCRSHITVEWDGMTVLSTVVAPQVLKTMRKILWDTTLVEVWDAILAAGLLAEDEKETLNW